MPRSRSNTPRRKPRKSKSSKHSHHNKVKSRRRSQQRKPLTWTQWIKLPATRNQIIQFAMKGVGIGLMTHALHQLYHIYRAEYLYWSDGAEYGRDWRQVASPRAWRLND